jgi:hypothetical protein
MLQWHAQKILMFLINVLEKDLFFILLKMIYWTHSQKNIMVLLQFFWKESF